jgi:type I restriction enzyme M protein
MLTEAQDFIIDPEGSIRSKAAIYLYGKEVNPETYAICKSDMMIKGNNPENIRYGSTLATDEFSGTRFDFMLSNPPYGKSWKTDQGQVLEKNGANTVIIDPRFEVKLPDPSGQTQLVSAAPAVDDGQLLFLMEMVSKMKPSRIRRPARASPPSTMAPPSSPGMPAAGPATSANT